MNHNRFAAVTAALAGVLLGLMLLVSLRTGITQQAFEFVMPVAIYASELIRYAAPLRIILSLDFFFIVAYVLGTFYLCRLLSGRGANPALVRFALLLVIAGGILDLSENMHILAMLRAAEQVITLTAGQIELQAVLSAVKWHFAYAAFVIVGVALKPRNLIEKLFAFALIWLQTPVGVLVYTAPTAELSQLFQMLRYANLVSGFFIIALIAWNSRGEES